MTTTKNLWWVWGSLALMLAMSVTGLAKRYRVEASNRAYGLLIEAAVLNETAAASGTTFQAALKDLKSHGLTGVALSEESLQDLVIRGEAKIDRLDTLGVRISAPPGTLARVARAVSRRGGMASPLGKTTSSSIEFYGDLRVLLASSVGINPDDASAVRSVGLSLVARHANVIGAGPRYIDDLLAESHDLGATAFLPAGEQVLGQRTCVEDMTSSLALRDMVYLTPEFTKIGGDSKATGLAPERVVRLHSMQQAEVDKSSFGGMVDRYKLAFRERNIRWMLVRPSSFGGQDALTQAGAVLSALDRELTRAGGSNKVPRPFQDPEVPSWIQGAVTLVSVPWMAFALAGLWSRKPNGLCWAMAGLFGTLGMIEPTRPYATLALAVLGPVLALALWFENPDSAPIFAYIQFTLVCLLVGLAAAATMNSLPYLIQVKQVLGVKAILLGPVVLCSWMLVQKLTKFSTLSGEPAKWGQLLFGILLLAALAVLLVRSGNDAPGAVSDSELKFRALLDKLLYTRPRTKEIMLGQPAMVIGLLLAKYAKKGQGSMSWSYLALALGSVGLADIVDTMCHTHTPLDIGVARILIGAVLGGLIGWAAWQAGMWIKTKTGARPQPSMPQ